MILIVIQIRSKLRDIIDHLGVILTKLDGKTYIKKACISHIMEGYSLILMVSGHPCYTIVFVIVRKM